jgi:hypothetical protein
VRCRGRAERRPPGEQLERVIEVSSEPAQPECVTAPSRELDGKRNAIQLAADVRDDRCARIVELECAKGRRRTLDEQSHRREAERLRSRESHRGARSLQGRQTVHMLALRAQGFTAGRQDLDARGAPQDPRRQRSGRLDDMLAVIEHEQHRLALQ